MERALERAKQSTQNLVIIYDEEHLTSDKIYQSLLECGEENILIHPHLDRQHQSLLEVAANAVRSSLKYFHKICRNDNYHDIIYQVTGVFPPLDKDQISSSSPAPSPLLPGRTV